MSKPDLPRFIAAGAGQSAEIHPARMPACSCDGCKYFGHVFDGPLLAEPVRVRR